VSIRAVAARAGVSPATVSRVFTQAASVSAATRRRVEAAAEELAYVPNPVARSLARGRTGNLGIVVPDIANSFASVIAKAVHREARAAGYALFIAGSDRRPDEEYRLARAMASQVDGLLMMSPRIDDELLEQLSAMTPLAVINRVVDGCPAVLITTADGMNQAVEHLHALGAPADRLPRGLAVLLEHDAPRRIPGGLHPPRHRAPGDRSRRLALLGGRPRG